MHIHVNTHVCIGKCTRRARIVIHSLDRRRAYGIWAGSRAPASACPCALRHVHTHIHTRTICSAQQSLAHAWHRSSHKRARGREHVSHCFVSTQSGPSIVWRPLRENNAEFGDHRDQPRPAVRSHPDWARRAVALRTHLTPELLVLNIDTDFTVIAKATVDYAVPAAAVALAVDVVAQMSHARTRDRRMSAGKCRTTCHRCTHASKCAR